ncbi:MAG: glycerophosphodiester phosphodiesterase, partial [Endozoicomonadaceae bacterium]|nr:glycerophosphodiester phosphodiesterase [Endozoicomonadaceae bacterium]
MASGIVFGHRGASGYYCENTRSSFDYAHALGVRDVEIDCQLCGDGELILFHDDTLDRLCNVSVA